MPYAVFLVNHSNDCLLCAELLQVVKLQIDPLKLESHQSCAYDNLTLYNGDSAKSAMKLGGPYCRVEQGPVNDVLSLGRSVFVVFQSDFAVNKGRFKLKWTFQKQTGHVG